MYFAWHSLGLLDLCKNFLSTLVKFFTNILYKNYSFPFFPIFSSETPIIERLFLFFIKYLHYSSLKYIFYDLYWRYPFAFTLKVWGFFYFFHSVAKTCYCVVYILHLCLSEFFDFFPINISLSSLKLFQWVPKFTDKQEDHCSEIVLEQPWKLQCTWESFQPSAFLLM